MTRWKPICTTRFRMSRYAPQRFPGPRQERQLRIRANPVERRLARFVGDAGSALRPRRSHRRRPIGWRNHPCGRRSVRQPGATRPSSHAASRLIDPAALVQLRRIPNLDVPQTRAVDEGHGCHDRRSDHRPAFGVRATRRAPSHTQRVLIPTVRREAPAPPRAMSAPAPEECVRHDDEHDEEQDDEQRGAQTCTRFRYDVTTPIAISRPAPLRAVERAAQSCLLSLGRLSPASAVSSATISSSSSCSAEGHDPSQPDS